MRPAWRACPTAASTCPRRRSGAWASAPCSSPESEAAATVELPGPRGHGPERQRPRAGDPWRAYRAAAEGPAGGRPGGQARRRAGLCAPPRRALCAGQPAGAAGRTAQPACSWPNSVCSASKSLEGTVPRKEIEAARAEAQSLQQRERSIGASLAAREALVAPVSRRDRARRRAGRPGGRSPRRAVRSGRPGTRCWSRPRTADVGAGRAHRRRAACRACRARQLKLLGAARVLRDGVLPLTFTVRADEAGHGAAAGHRPAGDADRRAGRAHPGRRAAGAGRRAQPGQRARRLDQVGRRALHPAAGAVPGARRAARWS